MSYETIENARKLFKKKGIHVCTQTIINWIKSGKFPGVKIGGRWFVPVKKDKTIEEIVNDNFDKLLFK